MTFNESAVVLKEYLHTIQNIEEMLRSDRAGSAGYSGRSYRMLRLRMWSMERLLGIEKNVCLFRLVDWRCQNSYV